jgi:hypothetical protein
MNRLAWFAMLAILPIAAAQAQEKQKAAPAPKPPVVKPLLPPSKSTPVENQDIDKRRERMKQRDSEIDKMLKERQRKEAERNREKR